jgi:hypothetical protein
MSEDTTSTPRLAAATPLLAALVVLLAAHRPAFGQDRPFARAVALVYASLFAFARHTITQLLVALGQTEHDWSAWYRLFNVPRLDYAALTRCYLRQTLEEIGPDGPYVAVVDGVQVPRHSRTMPGTTWLKHPRTPVFFPGIHRAQRFVHLASLLPREQGYSRALPLRFEQAFPPKAVRREVLPARKEWEAAQAAMTWLRTELDAAGRREQHLLVVGDGSYDTAGLWTSLPARTSLVARTARNRALFALPVREPKRRGAPRKYGERAPVPAAWLQERTGWQEATLVVRGRTITTRYRVEGPVVVRTASSQPLFLLIVPGINRRSGRRRRERDPHFWLVNAVQQGEAWVLPLPATELLAWAWQRWEIEVSHRELKTTLGVGEMQCWSVTAAVLTVQWQVWSYGVLVLAGYRAWGLVRQTVRPPGRWWTGAPRWSLATLWRGYRQELWGQREFHALWTGTAGIPAENGAWMKALTNAVLGASRT